MSPGNARNTPRWIVPLAAAAGAVVLFVLGWLRHRQGIDLSDQGLWVLGTKALSTGHAVHAHLETGDGPLRYWLLRPFAAAAGGGFAGWALLHATLLAVAGAALGFGWRRVGAFALVWPLALLAVGRVPLAAVLALGTAAMLGASFARQKRWKWILGGALLAVTASVDPRWGVAAALLALGAAPPALRGRTALDLALGAVGAVALGHGLATLHGVGAEAWRNTWTLGWRNTWTGLSDGGGMRWWQTLRGGAWLDLPFADLRTGETLGPAWPGHAFLRAGSIRLLALCVLLSPALALWHRRGGRATVAGVASAIAWLWISGGDLPGLRESLLLAVGLLVLAGPRWSLASVAVLCLPLAAEFVWLVGTGTREGVSEWERAGVLVTDSRQERWESLAETMAPIGADPVLVWPSWPGLHALLDLEPATRYVSLDRSAASASVLAERLAAVRPEAVVLAADRRFSRALDDPRLAPAWDWMRGNYRIGLTASGGTDRFRVLRRLLHPETELATVPLPERLPLVELTVANERSPALRTSMSLGQSFDVGPRDFEGFALRWSTRGENLELKLRVRVWQRRGREFDTLLAFDDVTVTVERDGDRTWIRYPVEATAGLHLAVVVELREDPAEEVRLYWHRPDAGERDVDLYPEGSAILDLQPIEADLFFVAY